MKAIWILFLMTAFAGCHETSTQQTPKLATAIIAVTDVTDRRELWLRPDPILAIYDCEMHPESECVFTLTAITDRTINPVYTAQLPDNATTEQLNKQDDAQFRNKCIIGFYSAVRKDFSDAYKEFDTAGSMRFSECWAAISDALQQLQKCKCTRKILIVASDLMENSSVFNAYTDGAHTSTETMASKFKTAVPVSKDLKGISIFFVFQPQTREEDKNYTRMLKVYKYLLEPLGATIHVQANNTNYQL